jgi:hypothetical protein
MLRTALTVGTMVVGGALGHAAHRRADAARFEALREHETLYQPNGAVLRVVAFGQHTTLADFFWVRAVLQFSDIFDDDSTQGIRWLESTLNVTIELDPTWRTVYFYGGSFMRVLGDVDASDRIFIQGMEALPDDPFFPFSLGMNAYLHHDDVDEAARMLKIAAATPGAPGWYSVAAASFLQAGGQRAAAVRYLDEELLRTEDPRARARLEDGRNRLVHDHLEEKLAERQAAFRAQVGRDAVTLEELGPLPPDPFDEGWVLAADGHIRSQHEEARVARIAVADERAMILRPLEKPVAPAPAPAPAAP